MVRLMQRRPLEQIRARGVLPTVKSRLNEIRATGVIPAARTRVEEVVSKVKERTGAQTGMLTREGGVVSRTGSKRKIKGL